MKAHLHLLSFSLAFLLLCQLPVFAQKSKLVTSKSGTTTSLTLSGLDTLTRISGAPKPYYTYLWVFGDGTFVNGTRDSALVKHIYKRNANASYLQGAGPFKPDVTVYMTGHYSGGARPPRKGVVAPPPPDSFFLRPPSVARHDDGVSLNIGDILNPPGTPATVFSDPNQLLKLQLNHNVMPGDTLASIVSFRSPIKPAPGAQTLRGQVLLFYNSQAKTGMAKLPPLLKGEVAPPPPPPAPARYGKFNFRNSPQHYTNVYTTGNWSTKFPTYKEVVGWTYDSLPPADIEERNVFAEFGSDTAMWQLYRNNVGDTLSFLAVFTAISSNPDLLGILPEIDTTKIDPAIVNLLRDSMLTNDGFLPLSVFDPNQGSPSTKILGFSEIKTPVVAAHDPNNLTLYTCKCPAATGGRKLLGVVEFSNDGNAPTSRVVVKMKIPDQLDLASLQHQIDIFPAPAPLGFSVDEATRTVTWDWLAALPPASERGFGHPDTKGHIVFSALFAEGSDPSQLEPMQACIKFDIQDTMCTSVVPNTKIIMEFQGGVAGTELECVSCEAKGDCWCGDYCWLLYLIGAILLLILVVWWQRSRP